MLPEFGRDTHWRWERRWCWLWLDRRAVTLTPYTYGDLLTVLPGVAWNGPSLGLALDCRMRATLLHDILRRPGMRLPTTTNVSSNDVLVCVLREDGATWFAWLCRTPVARALFWASWRWTWFPG